jgi:hypothetical protein
VGLIGFFFLISSLEVLTELYLIIELIDSFFDIYELTTNSIERFLAKAVFAFGMGLIYLVLAFFALVVIKCCLFLVTFLTPLKLSNSEKKILSVLKCMNTEHYLNPSVTRERRYLFPSYYFEFTKIHSELNLEELITAIKPSISLIGVQITFGTVLFFLYSIPLITYYELIVGIIIVVTSGIFSIVLVKNEYINSIQTFWEYHKLKKFVSSYYQDEFTKILSSSIAEDKRAKIILEFLVLKEKQRDLKNLRMLPISNIIKLWSVPGLIISFISLVL